MPKTAETPGLNFFSRLMPPGLPLYATIFFFINALFVLKYGARTAVGPVGALVGYGVFFLIHLAVAGLIGRFAARSRSPWLWPSVFVGVYGVAALAIYLRLDPENLQTDRWSALHNFLAALFRGEYPYAARTHLDSPISGFPGLFLLALPFYAVGDVGYLQFAALIALAALLVIRLRDGGRPLYLLALLVAMPVFEYQIFGRSDLLGNMVAVAWLMHLGAKPGAARGNYLWLWAIAWGLMLSTRAIVLIPMILAAGGFLNGRGWKTAAGFFAVAGTVTIATFLPFYLWNPVLFWEHNPFNVQAGYISRPVLAAVLAITLWLAYRYRRSSQLFSQLFYHAGLILFGTVFVCWLLKVFQTGWAEMLWNHTFDLTYFFLGVPFLLVAWGSKEPS